MDTKTDRETDARVKHKDNTPQTNKNNRIHAKHTKQTKTKPETRATTDTHTRNADNGAQTTST